MVQGHTLGCLVTQSHRALRGQGPGFLTLQNEPAVVYKAGIRTYFLLWDLDLHLRMKIRCRNHVPRDT